MRWAAITALVLGCVGVSMTMAAPETPSRFPALINKYCLNCHSDSAQKRGLVPIALDALDFTTAVKDAETWEKIVRKVDAGVMPPPGSPSPGAPELKALTAWITGELDKTAQSNPNPGRAPLLHRLNRTEYANAIRDLLDLEIDAASLLPADDSAYGFDNISDALGLSPALQERYVSAAMKIAALAVGSPRVSAEGATFRIPQDVSQDQHIEGLPLGTIGGARVRHNFPLDGEYEFQARLYRTNLNIMRGLETPHEIEFAVDGQHILTAKVGGPEDLAALFQKQAGLKPADLMVEFDHKPIQNLYDFTYALQSKQAGDVVEVVVQRAGQTLRVNVTLEMRQ